MAIFGTLNNMAPLFSKTEELEYLHLQIRSSFGPEFMSKIQSLKEGENFKTTLDYGMFFITHCYALKDEKEGFFEAHQEYIDVQVVLEGFERYLIGNKNHFDLKNPYDSQKDLEVYTPISNLSELVLSSQEICILFPFDIHGVGIGRGEEIGQIVKKAIFKIPKALIKHRL